MFSYWRTDFTTIAIGVLLVPVRMTRVFDRAPRLILGVSATEEVDLSAP